MTLIHLQITTGRCTDIIFPLNLLIIYLRLKNGKEMYHLMSFFALEEHFKSSINMLLRK